MTPPRPDSAEFLRGRINYERAPAPPQDLNLDRMRELLAQLGNPHHALRIVHIAGTKGKGSTATMIAAALSAAGHKTGLYTSPHLVHLGERFSIDGQCCSSAEVAQLIEAVRPAVAVLDRLAAQCSEMGPTYFEITTAMAFWRFAQQRTDIAVIEVGMGGRLDSTNVCDPLLAVITSISQDHTRQLGESLPAIAVEKAGIIKPGRTVICGVRPHEPRRVIQQIAQQRGAPFYCIEDDFAPTPRDNAATPPGNAGAPQPPGGSIFDYEETSPEQNRIQGLQVGLRGRHQIENAAVAVAALQTLVRLGWKIPQPAIRKGLAAARCAARVEVVRHRPTVLLDAAHNPASVEALLDVLRAEFPAEKKTLVFATSRDKDAAKMLALLAPCFEHLILTRFLGNPRSADPQKLAQLAEQALRETPRHRPRISIQDDPLSAWRLAQGEARENDLICIAGSFFIAGELRQIIQAGAASPRETIALPQA